MSELTTTGTWIVEPSKEVAFVDAWARFAEWASARPGATTLRLTHDPADERRFVSFAAWDSAEAVQAWRADPEFEEHMAQILQHVDDFHSEQLVVVAAASNGNKSIELAARNRTA